MADRGRDGPSQITREFDAGDCPPTVAVVESVARYRDEDPLDIDPLANHIDPGALNRLLRDGDDAVIQFRWGDVWVVAASTGEIVVSSSR